MEIKYGNLTGRFFNQIRVDILNDFAAEVNRRLPAITSFESYYDNDADFQHLKFGINGKTFDVRLYKGFGLNVNGVGVWSGCPVHRQQNMIDFIASTIS